MGFALFESNTTMNIVDYGLSIGDIVTVLCVGGGISNEGDNLIIPLAERVYKEVYNKTEGRRTKICTAKLANDAGVIGAALLNK